MWRETVHSQSYATLFRHSSLDNGRPDVRTLPSPRLIHSHLTYDVIPNGKGCKYMYIARNPKDVAVLFYEFMKAHGPSGGYNGPWEFFARIFMEGRGEKWCSIAQPWTSALFQ